MTIDVEVAPYRVEWRRYLTVRWLLIDVRSDREEADALAIKTLAMHGGYCRLISQHVISSSGRPGGWAT